MTVTINISPDKEAALQAQAQARGLTVEELLAEYTDQLIQPASITHLQKTDPNEWARRFDAWVDSHDRNTPVLSDDAMSRESIYQDRA